MVSHGAEDVALAAHRGVTMSRSRSRPLVPMVMPPPPPLPGAGVVSHGAEATPEAAGPKSCIGSAMPHGVNGVPRGAGVLLPNEREVTRTCADSPRFIVVKRPSESPRRRRPRRGRLPLTGWTRGPMLFQTSRLMLNSVRMMRRSPISPTRVMFSRCGHMMASCSTVPLLLRVSCDP